MRQNGFSFGAGHSVIPALRNVPTTFNGDEANMNALTTCERWLN
jgi:hypothetical protein